MKLYKIKNFIKFLSEIRVDDSLDQLEECDVLFFCHDVDRPITLNGKAYSPLLDSVREEIERKGLKCFSISYPWSKLTGKYGYAFPLSFNRSFLFYKLRNVFNRFFHSLFSVCNISPFEKILSVSKAKLVITIGCPDDLCYQARLLKVLHLELLHGIGYNSVPWGWDKKEERYLPQGILALDKLSAQSFSNLSVKEIKLVPHPFLKRFISSNNRNLPKEWLPKKPIKKKWKKEILVSLQWAYAGDHGEHLKFANILDNGLFFKEIERIISEEKEILWRFRFHPVQLRMKKYKYLLKYMDDFVAKYANTEWRESSNLPFPSIVMSCDGNVTMSSMSCYDAAAFGVPSLMLCPTILPGAINEDRFLDLLNEGYVLKSKPKYELLKSWFLNVSKTTPRLSNLEDEESWESALKWMLAFKY